MASQVLFYFAIALDFSLYPVRYTMYREQELVLPLSVIYFAAQVSYCPRKIDSFSFSAIVKGSTSCFLNVS